MSLRVILAMVSATTFFISFGLMSRHANEVLALKINLRVRGLPQDP